MTGLITSIPSERAVPTYKPAGRTAGRLRRRGFLNISHV
ncbi:hypothetical protein BN903_27 [Halorubrum sp. AJ67]|nr:hypothetical protein BN903_27 [Halorubrum sp. AJ67]